MKPENIVNPIVAMNYYNATGGVKKKKKLKRWKCPDCGQSIPEGYVDCIDAPNCPKSPATPCKPVQGQEKTKKCACGNGVYPGCGDKCQECVI